MAGKPRLRDLHLGLDRLAERSHGTPPRRRELPRLGRVCLWPRRLGRCPGPFHGGGRSHRHRALGTAGGRQRRSAVAGRCRDRTVGGGPRHRSGSGPPQADPDPPRRAAPPAGGRGVGAPCSAAGDRRRASPGCGAGATRSRQPVGQRVRADRNGGWLHLPRDPRHRAARWRGADRTPDRLHPGRDPVAVAHPDTPGRRR